MRVHQLAVRLGSVLGGDLRGLEGLRLLVELLLQELRVSGILALRLAHGVVFLPELLQLVILLSGGGGQGCRLILRVLRRAGQGDDGAGQDGQPRGNAHDDIQAGDGSGQRGARHRRQLCRCGVCRDASHDQPDHADRSREAFDQRGVLLEEVIDCSQHLRGRAVELGEHRRELLANGGLHGLPGGVHQRDLADHVVHLDVGHLLGCAGAVVDAVRQLGVVRLAGVQHGEQSGIAALPGDGRGVVDLLRFGHLVEVAAQLIDGGGEVGHCAVRLHSGDLHLAEGLTGQRNAAQQAVEHIAQRRAGVAALDACIGHQADGGGDVLDGVAESSGDRRGVFEGLAHDGDGGVRVGCGGGEDVSITARVSRAKAECGHAVRDNIRHGGEVFTGCCGQREHARHTFEHLLGRPASHRHVAHGVGAFLRRELGGRAQLLRHRGELRQLLAGGAGQGLHVGHGGLEISGDADALHVALIDFLEGRGDAGRGDRGLRRAECVGGLLPEAVRLLRGIFLFLLEVGHFRRKALAFLAEVGGVHPRIAERLPHLVELLRLAFEGRGGLVDLLLLREQLVLQVGGVAPGLLDLLLDVVILLLQQFQLLLRTLHGLLLLLVRGDVALRLIEGLNLLLHGDELLLCLAECAAEATGQLRVQRKKHRIFFPRRHLSALLSGYFLFSCTISLLVLIHAASSRMVQERKKVKGVLLLRAMMRHCLRSHFPPSPVTTPHEAKKTVLCRGSSHTPPWGACGTHRGRASGRPRVCRCMPSSPCG